MPAGASSHDLRKRFKELYPAYHALNEKLEAERVRAERVLAGDGKRASGLGLGLDEIERDVGQRAEWHAELEEIKKRLKSELEGKKKAM